jgi:hypothetical protein
MDHTIKRDSQAHVTAISLFLSVAYCHSGNNSYGFLGNLSISRMKCFPAALPKECTRLRLLYGSANKVTF